MTRAEWVKAFRAEVEKRIREYEQMPEAVKANGFARLAIADSIAEVAVQNVKLLDE